MRRRGNLPRFQEPLQLGERWAGRYARCNSRRQSRWEGRVCTTRNAYQDDDRNKGNVNEEVSWLTEPWGVEFQPRSVSPHFTLLEQSHISQEETQWLTEIKVEDEREAASSQDERRKQAPELRGELEDKRRVEYDPHGTEET